MAGFADKVRLHAAVELRRTYHHQVTRDADPVLELVGFLLEDGAGGVLSHPQAPVTTEQWLTWNQLAMEREKELARAASSVLEEEIMELPEVAEAMRYWAASLLLKTLDRMGMA
jgi:hypothetical protein